MEEDLLAVKCLAFGINLIASSDRGIFIERGVADALWQIARQIGVHADALKGAMGGGAKETAGDDGLSTPASRGDLSCFRFSHPGGRFAIFTPCLSAISRRRGPSMTRI
jgi:hypothetical protein